MADGIKQRSGVTDGATAIAYDFNTKESLVTTGAKLASFKNAAVEQIYIDKDGNIHFAKTGSDIFQIRRDTAGSGGNFHSFEFVDGVNGTYVMDGGGKFYYSTGTTQIGSGTTFVTVGPSAAVSIQGSPITMTPNGGSGSLDLQVPLLNSSGSLNGRVNIWDDVEMGDATGSANKTIYSNRTDGASSIAHALDTTAAWSNTSARLLSIKNNGTEVISVDKNGALKRTSDLNVTSSTVYAETGSYSKSTLLLSGGSKYFQLEAFDNDSNDDVFIDGTANGATSGITMLVNPGAAEATQLKLYNFAGGSYGGTGGKDLAFAVEAPKIGTWISFIGLSDDGWFSGGAGTTLAATKEWDFLSQARDDSDSNAYWFDTQFALTQSTAKLAVFANNLSEKFSLGINGGINVRRSSTASSVNSAGEVIIGVTSTAAPRTVTLDTSDVVAGRIMIIKDESGGAGTNNITVDTEGSELIDGAASVVITANYGVLRLYSDGTNWFSW